MIVEHSMGVRMHFLFRRKIAAVVTPTIEPITKRHENTMRINQAELDLLAIQPKTPFGLRIGTALTYTTLPTRIAQPAQGVIWRIELHGLAPNTPPLGLDIVGDVTVGRSASGECDVDVALDDFGAAHMGVSRQHAMFRPTRNSLYLLDLDSTNGTYYNAMRLGPGLVHAVRNDDTITLGSFSFQIRVIDCPSMH